MGNLPTPNNRRKKIDAKQKLLDVVYTYEWRNEIHGRLKKLTPSIEYFWESIFSDEMRAGRSVKERVGNHETEHFLHYENI